MYKTTQLFLVVLHRTVLLSALLVTGTVIFAAVENGNYEDAGHFCWTVVTTIGYGKITPKTDWGKIFTIIYGLFGIPTAAFCLGSYGALINHTLKKVVTGCFCQKRQISTKILILICALLIIELFVGAYVMSLMYDWPYLDSVYAWFVTLTTIGFGDYVPGLPERNVGYALIYFFSNLFCLATLAAAFDLLQKKLSLVDNNRRGIYAIIFCCYNDDEKDVYDIQSISSSMLINLEVSKE